MNPFEDDLRESLRRREPPPGFAVRVLARVAQKPEKRSWFAFLGWRAAVAGALGLVIVAGGIGYEQRRQRRLEGERAKEQVMFALRVTGSKLGNIQQKLSDMQQRTISIPLER